MQTLPINPALWEFVLWGFCCFSTESEKLLWKILASGDCLLNKEKCNLVWAVPYFGSNIPETLEKSKNSRSTKAPKSCRSGKNKSSLSWHFVKFLSATHCSIPTLTGREKESWGGALSTAQITHFIIRWLMISIQTFSCFSLSSHYNLSVAKCFSTAEFSLPHCRGNSGVIEEKQ